MQKIASEKASQKSNVENDNIIRVKDILLWIFVSIPIWLMITIIIRTF
jgi:hypothetical protein